MTRCFWCGVVVGFDAQKDHVIPRKKYGPDEAWNMVISCRRCNQTKRDLWPSEWMSVLHGILCPNGHCSDSSECWMGNLWVQVDKYEDHFEQWATETRNYSAIGAAMDRRMALMLETSPLDTKWGEHVSACRSLLALQRGILAEQRRRVADWTPPARDFKRMPNGYGSAGRHPSGLVHFRMQVNGHRVSGYGRDLDTAQANCRRKLEEIQRRLHGVNYEAQP